MLAACASSEPAAVLPYPPPARADSPARAEPPAPPPPAKALDADAFFARVQPALEACYAAGLRGTPSMSDAKLTLDAAFDAHGVATCAIPRDDAGFTQDVADCMAGALARASVGGAPRLVTLPIAARAGALGLGPARVDSAVLASVETVRMPDAFDVLESLEPALAACVRGTASTGKSMIVAARVGASGAAECTLATSAGLLPEAASGCAAEVLRHAKFPAPRKGSGFIVIPLMLQ